jgi:hypothetical protein
MMKRLILLVLTVATLFVLVGLNIASSDNQTITVSPCCTKGVVDKTPCEAFTVEITFKNTGKTTGTWSVNIAFEGEAWIWSGTAQILTLKAGDAKSLSWNGSVPNSAPIDSVSRLIVYYNDSFKPLDWWIHIVSGAELTIKTSIVK